MSEQWEEVEVPRGAYIGWGFHPGQTVTGKVLAYAHNGGTDFNGNQCPQLSLELTEAADTYKAKGTSREQIAAGELVVVNAAQVSLKRAVIAAQPEPGDLIKLTFASVAKVADGEVKEFKVQIARGAGKGGGRAASAGTNPYAAASQDAEPPF